MKAAETTPPALPKITPSDRLGAVVPVLAPAALEGADLTNVIVLSHRRNAGESEAPPVSITSGARPAPTEHWTDRVPWTALIAGAVLLHLALVLVFMREPTPMPSLALDSISVEIVLGGQTQAGLAQIPSPEQSAPSMPSISSTEQARPVEQPTETAEDAKPELRPAIEPEKTPPEEAKREETNTAAASPEPEPAMAEAKPEPEPKKPEPEAAATAETPVTNPPPRPKETAQPQSRAAPNLAAASQSGVGVGSSRAVRDWASLVSAHLARNKRYPQDALARGIGGTASVAFTLDGDGRVTSVRLARSSGNASLDRESQDLVRRASPFPTPPQGKASITVPVNFNVRTAR